MLSLDEIFEINELLLGIDVKPELVENFVRLMVAKNRSLQDLNNLIAFARNKKVEGLGTYVGTMIRTNRFPGSINSTGERTSERKKKVLAEKPGLKVETEVAVEGEVASQVEKPGII